MNFIQSLLFLWAQECAMSHFPPLFFCASRFLLFFDNFALPRRLISLFIEISSSWAALASFRRLLVFVFLSTRQWSGIFSAADQLSFSLTLFSDSKRKTLPERISSRCVTCSPLECAWTANHFQFHNQDLCLFNGPAETMQCALHTILLARVYVGEDTTMMLLLMMMMQTVVAATTLGPIKMQLDLTARQQSHRSRQRFIDSNLVAVNGLRFVLENAINAIESKRR